MNVLPLFYPRKAKNAVTCSVTTSREILKVVPPGIEPGTQGFSGISKKPICCLKIKYLCSFYA